MQVINAIREAFSYQSSASDSIGSYTGSSIGSRTTSSSSIVGSEKSFSYMNNQAPNALQQTAHNLAKEYLVDHSKTSSIVKLCQEIESTKSDWHVFHKRELGRFLHREGLLNPGNLEPKHQELCAIALIELSSPFTKNHETNLSGAQLRSFVDQNKRVKFANIMMASGTKASHFV